MSDFKTFKCIPYISSMLGYNSKTLNILAERGDIAAECVSKLKTVLFLFFLKHLLHEL